jgi:hypothetical protein
MTMFEKYAAYVKVIFTVERKTITRCQSKNVVQLLFNIEE